MICENTKSGIAIWKLPIWDCYPGLNESRYIWELKNNSQNLPPEMIPHTPLAHGLIRHISTEEHQLATHSVTVLPTAKPQSKVVKTPVYRYLKTLRPEWCSQFADHPFQKSFLRWCFFCNHHVILIQSSRKFATKGSFRCKWNEKIKQCRVRKHPDTQKVTSHLPKQHWFDPTYTLIG